MQIAVKDLRGGDRIWIGARLLSSEPSPQELWPVVVRGLIAVSPGVWRVRSTGGNFVLPGGCLLDEIEDSELVTKSGRPK